MLRCTLVRIIVSKQRSSRVPAANIYIYTVRCSSASSPFRPSLCRADLYFPEISRDFRDRASSPAARIRRILRDCVARFFRDISSSLYPFFSLPLSTRSSFQRSNKRSHPSRVYYRMKLLRGSVTRTSNRRAYRNSARIGGGTLSTSSFSSSSSSYFFD